MQRGKRGEERRGGAGRPRFEAGEGKWCVSLTHSHCVAKTTPGWHSASGLPLKKFFNTSGQVYKALGLKDRLPDMSEEEQLQLLAGDGMLVKRPLLILDSGRVLVGFKEADWASELL